MIAYIKGVLAAVSEDSVIVDNNGMGIRIMVPSSSLNRLPDIGNEVQIFTYMYVREDMIGLFGFMSQDDLELFKLLITVKGVGTKNALAVLSAINADELRLAVLSGDIKTIQSAPGIGKKTAEMLVVELRDKIKNILPQGTAEILDAQEASYGNAETDVALEALTALGYSYAEAAQAVKSVNERDEKKAEQIIKEALTMLAK